MANYMKQVAEMLGVELGEEFKVVNKGTESRYVYRLAERGCESLYEDTWDVARMVLCGILCGDIEVKKLPYKPKKGNEYFSYYREDFDVGRGVWSDHPADYARLKCGMVFRTEEEAIEARSRIYTELTGEEWK